MLASELHPDPPNYEFFKNIPVQKWPPTIVKVNFPYSEYYQKYYISKSETNNANDIRYLHKNGQWERTADVFKELTEAEEALKQVQQ